MSVIVVTGARRGIGAAIACALAEAGHIVGCLSRSGTLPAMPAGDSAVQSRLRPLQADVTQPQEIRRALGELVEAVGPLTGLVNNAGIHEESRSEEMSREQWDAVMTSNAFSAVLCCQAAYPHLLEAGGGLIVNIGSFFDKLGVKRNLAYCASKAAVGAITRVLAVEWARAAIRVLDVAPGYVLTDLNQDSLQKGPLKAYLDGRIPLRRTARAEEIGALVALLFNAGNSFMTGETLYVDGGQGIAH